MLSTGSTNEDLSVLARTSERAELTDFTVIATDDQRSGRGRLGREWVSPPGACLAASVLIRPQTPSGRPLEAPSWGWYPLLAGLAMTRTIASLLPRAQDARLKWPNDVLVATAEGPRKVSGILCELVPDSAGELVVIVGSGVNLTLASAELPVETASSLALVGASTTDIDEVLATYLRELRHITRVFEAAAGDVMSSGLRAEVIRSCDTLGRRVRVDLPDGSHFFGVADTIDETGALVVTIDSPATRSGERVSVAAGDVTHVRII